MTYSGTVKNGVVVLEGLEGLPDGTRVRVEPVEADATPARGSKTLGEALLELAGAIDDLPADFARNHDHYIHGQPRR